MFNELRRLGQWQGHNPLAELRQFKVQERELSFLTVQQAAHLMEVLSGSRNRHVAMIARVCLATGSRWSEAENLEDRHVRNGQIQFVETKSGRMRAIPIALALESSLRTHHDKSETGTRLFAYAYSAFREGVERAGLKLSEGQLTHVLRHTFASHFMMNGGNILVLQRALGHANLTMTMRYAHLSPDHLQEVSKLNPLAALRDQRGRSAPRTAPAGS